MKAADRVYIVLFRGVGGATQLPTKQLREALAAAGFSKVSTYINSGNAVVASPLPAAKVRAGIAAIVREEFAFTKEILVVGRAEWEEAIAANPYPEAVARPTTLHLFTLEGPPGAAEVAALRARATGSERFEVEGRFLYLHAPDGFGTSKFVPKIETSLDVPLTARNWNTVVKLAQIAGGAD